MMTHLQIQGLAIIDSLSIEFSSGLNIITGETGAGKSILIRALHFLMGGKAASDTVRQGSPSATVVGAFWVPKAHRAQTELERLGIPFESTEGGLSILIRRQLTHKGRSQAWINDTIVTNGPLREVGMALVDVFGQHENQRLMDASQHSDYIDDFLEEEEPKASVEKLYAESTKIIAELHSMLETYHARIRSQDYLAFRLDELQKFEASKADFERAQELTKKAEGLINVRDLFSRAITLMEGDEEAKGMTQSIKEVARLLGQFASQAGPDALLSKGAQLKEDAAHIGSALDNLSYELARFASEFEVDERELESAQNRLFGYQDLFRKHSVRDIEALLAEQERLVAELELLESASTQLENSLMILEEGAGKLQKAALLLTQAREKAAQSIKKKVEAELQELAMPGSKLEVEFSSVQRNLPSLSFEPFKPSLGRRWQESTAVLKAITERGAERGQFLLASNPGEPLLPLNRVASGGELSRVMLAMKKALAADAETCVLVFDEIDAGISGRVADVVGKKMRELASAFQVICISHLPQVAVYADTHFLVTKEGKGKRTQASILKLSEEQSAGEIARLLSGAEVSRSSLENARTLMEKARPHQGEIRIRKRAPKTSRSLESVR